MNGGAFGENFPYSNFHDLNMDWIIKITKDFLDQYTSIQNTITQGLEDLDEKAEALQTLLQEWYNTHSEDIQSQLAEALNDLNTWYTQHQGYLDQYLENSIQDFNTQADQKAEQTLASIPSDYTALYNDVVELKSIREAVIEESKNLMPETGNTVSFSGVTASYSDGTISVSGTATGDGGRLNRLTALFTLEAGTYYISAIDTDGESVVNVAIQDSNNSLLAILNNNKTILTLNSTTQVFLGISVTNGVTYNNTIEIQIETEQFTDWHEPSFLSAEDFIARSEINKFYALFGEYAKPNITFTDGSYINYTSGAIGALGGNSASGYIPVIGGENVQLSDYSASTWSDVRGVAFYDANNSFIKGIQLPGTTANFIVPEGSAYLRITVETAYVNTYQIYFTFGNLISEVGNFYGLFGDYAKPDITFTDGSYINYANGTVNALGGNSISNYIPIVGNENVSLSDYSASTWSDARGLAFYDKNQSFIKGIQLTGATASFVVPEGASYLRITVETAYVNTYQIYFTFGNLISKIAEEIGQPTNPSIATFEKIGFCGDSYVAGQLYNSSGVIGEFPDLAWGSVIGRLCGIESKIYASSGADTNTWQSRAGCLPALLAETIPCGLYIFCMGINDNTYVTLGSMADITSYSSYTEYPNTFYGNYGKIIEQIQAYSPNSKIILMTPFHPSYNARYVAPLTEIAEHYSIAMINTQESSLCTMPFANAYVHGHPTSLQQGQMANNIITLVENCMESNSTYFSDYHGV